MPILPFSCPGTFHPCAKTDIYVMSGNPDIRSHADGRDPQSLSRAGHRLCEGMVKCDNRAIACAPGAWKEKI